MQPSGAITVLQQSQYKRHCEWANKDTNTDGGSDTDDKALLVPNLSDAMDINDMEPEIVKDPCPLDEELHLGLEEAFFLSYGLGCLVVEDINEKPMDLLTMWNKYCAVKEDFLYSYIGYHYFRSKGWVVTTGIKYGVDFRKFLTLY